MVVTGCALSVLTDSNVPSDAPPLSDLGAPSPRRPWRQVPRREGLVAERVRRSEVRGDLRRGGHGAARRGTSVASGLAEPPGPTNSGIRVGPCSCRGPSLTSEAGADPVGPEVECVGSPPRAARRAPPTRTAHPDAPSGRGGAPAAPRARPRAPPAPTRPRPRSRLNAGSAGTGLAPSPRGHRRRLAPTDLSRGPASSQLPGGPRASRPSLEGPWGRGRRGEGPGQSGGRGARAQQGRGTRHASAGAVLGPGSRPPEPVRRSGTPA